MSTANETRRSVMLIAWDFFRADREEGFGSALRRAWAWVKKSAAHTKRFLKASMGAKTVRFFSYSAGLERRSTLDTRYAAQMGV